MHIQAVILPVILQVITITTTALVLHITHPTSLLQDHNATADSTTLHLQPSNLTDRYSVECELKTFQRPIGLSPSDCLDAASYMCDWLSKIQPGTMMTETWVWLSRPHCALGYYLPGSYQHRAKDIPGEEECSRDIYGMIIERCAFRNQYNVGSINVEQWPSGHYPGRALKEEYPRYVMAPKELTGFGRGQFS